MKQHLNILKWIFKGEKSQLSNHATDYAYVEGLEKKSISIIREAKAQFKNPAVLWSTGKDSTTTIWLCKKAFFGVIPFPVIHIDTGCKFPEIYEFRDKLAKEWDLNLSLIHISEPTRPY